MEELQKARRKIFKRVYIITCPICMKVRKTTYDYSAYEPSEDGELFDVCNSCYRKIPIDGDVE